MIGLFAVTNTGRIRVGKFKGDNITCKRTSGTINDFAGTPI